MDQGVQPGSDSQHHSASDWEGTEGCAAHISTRHSCLNSRIARLHLWGAQTVEIVGRSAGEHLALVYSQSLPKVLFGTVLVRRFTMIVGWLGLAHAIVLLFAEYQVHC